MKVLQVGRSFPAVRQDGRRRMTVVAAGSGVQNVKGGLVVSDPETCQTSNVIKK